MNQKQYADMTTIMQICRIFAEQMYKCLDHSGLNGKGFRLDVRIDPHETERGEQLNATVDLEERICEVGAEQWQKTCMAQAWFEERGWVVWRDPKGEIGDAPTDVLLQQRTEMLDRRVAEDSRKPYPPDGLWIGADYHHSDVGGGQ